MHFGRWKGGKKSISSAQCHWVHVHNWHVTSLFPPPFPVSRERWRRVYIHFFSVAQGHHFPPPPRSKKFSAEQDGTSICHRRKKGGGVCVCVCVYSSACVVHLYAKSVRSCMQSPLHTSHPGVVLRCPAPVRPSPPSPPVSAIMPPLPSQGIDPGNPRRDRADTVFTNVTMAVAPEHTGYHQLPPPVVSESASLSPKISPSSPVMTQVGLPLANSERSATTKQRASTVDAGVLQATTTTPSSPAVSAGSAHSPLAMVTTTRGSSTSPSPPRLLDLDHHHRSKSHSGHSRSPSPRPAMIPPLACIPDARGSVAASSGGRPSTPTAPPSLALLLMSSPSTSSSSSLSPTSDDRRSARSVLTSPPFTACTSPPASPGPTSIVCDVVIVGSPGSGRRRLFRILCNRLAHTPGVECISTDANDRATPAPSVHADHGTDSVYADFAALSLDAVDARSRRGEGETEKAAVISADGDDDCGSMATYMLPVPCMGWVRTRMICTHDPRSVRADVLTGSPFVGAGVVLVTYTLGSTADDVVTARIQADDDASTAARYTRADAQFAYVATHADMHTAVELEEWKARGVIRPEDTLAGTAEYDAATCTAIASKIGAVAAIRCAATRSPRISMDGLLSPSSSSTSLSSSSTSSTPSPFRAGGDQSASSTPRAKLVGVIDQSTPHHYQQRRQKQLQHRRHHHHHHGDTGDSSSDGKCIIS